MSIDLTVIERADKLMPSKEVLASLKEQAQALVDAGMLPPGYKTGAEALVVALKAREMGVMTMRGWQGMFPVTREGHSRIGFMGNFITGLIYERLPDAEFSTTINTPKQCTIKARRNKDAGFQEFIVTIEEAKASKWDVYYDKDAKCYKPKATWSDPANMLYWRCITRMANRLFGDITGGAAYTRDELDDIDKEEDVTPAVTAAESVPYLTVSTDPPIIEATVEQPEPKKESDPATSSLLANLKTELAFCDSRAAVEKVWKDFRISTADGKLLNEGLALKNARKAEVKT